jgi:hypothetical protein
MYKDGFYRDGMYMDGLYRNGMSRTEYTGTDCAEMYSTCVISGDILHGVDLWEGVEDVKSANKKLVLQKRQFLHCNSV